MKSFLEKKIDEYQEKESEISLLEGAIQQINEEIQRTKIQPLQDAIEEKKQEKTNLGRKTTVDIRFWDLVEELSELTGISPDDMLADVYGLDYGKENDTLEDFARKKPSQYFRAIISNNKDGWYRARMNREDGDFYYDIVFYSSLNEIQADGRRLIEHCYIEKFQEYGRSHEPMSTALFTNPKDTKDIICHFKLRDIAQTHEYDGYYPVDLITQAIINLENRRRKQSLEKIRRLVI